MQQIREGSVRPRRRGTMHKSRNSRATKSWVGALVISGLALVLTACSSSSSSSATAGSSAASSSGGSTKAATAAAAAVAAFEQRPTTLSVPALPSKPPAGKTVDFMACGLPVCQSYISLVQAAAAAVGWNEQTIQIGLTPQTETDGYAQAVRNDPAGVIGSGGVAASVVATQLQQLTAEHVPSVLVDVPSAGNATAALLSTSAQEQLGQEMGDWILANAHGKNAHVGIISTPATPVYDAAHTGLQKVLAGCSSCSTTVYSFPETDIGTTLPTNVVTFVRTHPDINYLFFDFSNEVDGVPAALQSAGLASQVKITTEDTTATETAYLKSGQEAATAAIPWPETLWNAFNVILRKQMGLSVTPAVDMQMPRMIFTGSNVLSSTTVAPPPLVANYQADFKAAWHV